MTTSAEGAKTARRGNPSGPERTCAGCGKRAAANELMRVVHDPSSGEVAVDLAGSGFGRGAHFHPTPDCVAKSLRGGLARVFKSKVVADAEAIGDEIVEAADRRIEGLLAGARRAGQLAVGSEVVVEALREGRAELVMVARDAAAAAKLPEVEKAVASGKALAFADKRRLGSLMTREEVAVVAIIHPGVAAAVAQTYRMSGPFRSSLGGAASTAAREMGDGGSPREVAGAQDVRNEEAWSSSEVR